MDGTSEETISITYTEQQEGGFNEQQSKVVNQLVNEDSEDDIPEPAELTEVIQRVVDGQNPSLLAETDQTKSDSLAVPTEATNINEQAVEERETSSLADNEPRSRASVNVPADGTKRAIKVPGKGVVLVDITSKPAVPQESKKEEIIKRKDEGTVADKSNKRKRKENPTVVSRKKSVVTKKKLSGERKKEKKVEKSKKEKGTLKNKDKPNTKKNHPALRNRSSPNCLNRAIKNLNVSQRRCLVEMGFGKLLCFNISDLPSKLAYHVVSSFDDKKLQIKVSDSYIKVTSQLVHEVLGLLWGGVRLQDVDCTNDDSSIAKVWKELNGETVTAVQLKDKILGSELADWEFRANFILLFANLMRGSVVRSDCDLSLLNHIRMDTNYRDIDWCLFLYEAIEGCKAKWNPSNTDKHYAGPWTLLTLIYVDGTKCNLYDVERRRPATIVWNTDTLKRRELAEMEEGDFGRVVMREVTDGVDGSDHDDIMNDPTEDANAIGVYTYKPRDTAVMFN